MGQELDISVGQVYQTAKKDLLAEAGVMLLVAGVVFFLGERTRVMSIIFAVVLAARFALLYKRGDVLIFLLGFLLGGGNDLLSMLRGVYAYKPPALLPFAPMPEWMVVFWGEAFLFFRRLMRYGPYLGEDQKPAALDFPLAADLLVIVVYRMIVYRFAAVPWLPDALYALILILRILAIPPKDHERKLMLTIFLLGPLYEILLIAGGLYDYQTPVFFGMPLWLIIYWIFIFRPLKAVIDRLEHYLIGKF